MLCKRVFNNIRFADWLDRAGLTFGTVLVLTFIAPYIAPFPGEASAADIGVRLLPAAAMRVAATATCLTMTFEASAAPFRALGHARALRTFANYEIGLRADHINRRYPSFL